MRSRQPSPDARECRIEELRFCGFNEVDPSRDSLAELIVRSPIVRLLICAFPVFAAASNTASAQVKSDSADARRRAVRAQARFEQIRRQHLPARYAVRADQCDARVGRFCHWDSKSDTLIAKEPRVTRRARAALLASLDSASRRSPRDGWIDGQRIRYLLEERNDSAALKVAMACSAAAWWCDALRGLALHESGAGAAADSAFARALERMPESERCRWTDMTPLLDDDQRKRYGKVGCGKNEELAARLWWLADPFLSVAGNDRQAEHYARHTMARILEPARTAHNVAWASDMRELTVRYGWSRYWTQEPARSHNQPSIVSGHEATPNYHFIPASLDVDSIHEVAFDLDQDRAAERYSPVIADRLIEISPQIAAFRRGDSVQVVAAFDVSGRRAFDSARVQASLVLAPDDRSVSVHSIGASRGALSIMVDNRPHLASIEVVSFDKGHAAWKRSGVWLPPAAPAAITMSDILLFEPAEEEVTDLGQAIPRALPETTVKRAKTGIYWEIYGLAEADSALPVTLTLTPVGQSVLRRFGESLGFVPRTSPLNIAWRDTPTAGVSTRSMVIDFSLVPRGRYRLRVQAASPGKAAAASEREIMLN